METNVKHLKYLLLVILQFSLTATIPPAMAERDDRPNVIVIMTDDQGYGDMSCHGNPYIRTPNIDKLHDSGIRLTDFHVDPMCTPTRAALMTGRYSTRTGAWLTYGGRNHLRRDEVTMADVFKGSGYKTAIFGKWHLGDSYPFRPMDRGFDESFVHGGGVIGEAPDYWGNDYYDDVYFRNGKPESASGYCTDVWFDEAIKFATENRNGPFFIYLPANAPHGPRHVPAEYVEPYMGKSDIPEDRARFYGMIANIDENIGRLRGRLSTLGLSENTIIIFLTDNGTAGGVKSPKKSGAGKNNKATDGFNAGMRGVKTSPYEGGHRAACFIHWPGAGYNTGRDINGLTAHFDLLPTLIDFCGLKAPDNVKFDGENLTPLIAGKTERRPKRTLFVHNQGWKGAKDVYEGLPVKYKDYCVMTEKWRMVGNELYDLKKDPSQVNDVSAKHPDVLKKLTDAYETWWSDVTARSNEFTPFVIDPEKQETVILTGQSWHGDAIPYNQQHVRSALKSNGYWMIDVERGGKYTIELRRWPRELNLAISDTYEHRLHDPSRYDVKNRLLQLPSHAICARTARLKVGSFDKIKDVKLDDKAISFTVDLSAGQQKLQTWLTTDNGDEYGAYYVYIGPPGRSENWPLVTEKKQNAAMQRLTVIDSQNELYTRFRYRPIKGLGYEKGVNRRDPSSIIKVGGKYYIWYTRNTSTKSKWLDADLWYATSKDGINWKEQGPAVKRGPEGAWDDYSVFTCNILVAEGKYYLCYQAETKTGLGINVVGMAKADSPDGPWTKLPEPILKTADDGKFTVEDPARPWRKTVIEEGSWDSAAVHDPGIIPRWGKYWLYYKGHGIDNRIWADSTWGVAVADNPEGPYVKRPLNPVTNSGHEVWVWPWKGGIAAIVDWAGPEKDTVQYSSDGVNFEVMASLEDIPPAGGAYIADKFDDPKNGQGFSWGLCHYGRSDWNFLLRFDCDMKQGMEKKLQFQYFLHYSTVRDVMVDPERFGVPRQSLKRKR